MGLFTPRDGFDSLVRVEQYIGKVERTFGANVVKRFRFQIKMWNGIDWVAPLMWDTSTSVFREVSTLLAQNHEMGSRDLTELNIRVKRTGQALQTRYHVIIWIGSELSSFQVRGLENASLSPTGNRRRPIPSDWTIASSAIPCPANTDTISRGQSISWRPAEAPRQGPSLEEEFFDRNREDVGAGQNPESGNDEIPF